jgi:hypothetical protein
LRVIGVRLDLHDSWLDSGGVDDPSGAIDIDVGHADGTCKSFVDKGFHGGPGFLERDSVVIHDGSVLVARMLVVAGLERVRGVHQIQIDVSISASSAPVASVLYRYGRGSEDLNRAVDCRQSVERDPVLVVDVRIADEEVPHHYRRLDYLRERLGRVGEVQ